MRIKTFSNLNLLFRNCLVFSLVMLFVIMSVKSVYATDTEYYIRVGLQKSFFNFDELEIENSDITVGYKLEGDEKGELAPQNRGANFSGLEKVKISKDASFYVILDGSYDNFSSAENEAIRIRGEGLPAYTSIADPSTYAVAIGPFNDEEDAKLEINKLSSFGLNGKVYSDKNVFILTADKEIKFVFLSPKFNPQVRALNNSTITIAYDYYKEFELGSEILENVSDKAEYRGIIEIQRNENQLLRAINIVMLEEYLYSVVPSEMPSTWEIEALKAQAVAARNYVLTNKAYVDEGFDVVDTISSQVYRGYISETDRTTNAVNSTRGEVIYHDNEPINAFFFSSSGGHTANSEDVWVAEVPYLRGVEDSYDTTGKVWTRIFSQNDLTLGSIEAGYSVGDIQDVRIVETDDFGRVIKLKFIGTKGDFTIEKDAIRAFFYNVDYYLESTNFEIIRNLNDEFVSIKFSSTYIQDAENRIQKMDFDNTYINGYKSFTKLRNDVIYVLGSNNDLEIIEKESLNFENDNFDSEHGYLELAGKGWGHGIGLSQHGANGMAKAGYSYDEILSHYYTNIDIR